MTVPHGPVRIRDVTLREVGGADGVPLGVATRLAVLRALAAVPVAVAEVALPATPDDDEVLRRARADLGAGPTELSVAGRITPCGPPVTADPVLAAVLAAGIPRVSLAVDGRVAPAVRAGCGPAETISAVGAAVGHLVARGRRVLLDVEHAVDAFDADPVCLVDLVAAGLEAGAEAVVLDDTAGLALPDRVVAVSEAVVAGVGPGVGVACGDASGCAVANSLLATGVGARWLQTSARPGTAALVTTVRDLTRGGLAEVVPVPDLAGLEDLAVALDRLLGGTGPPVPTPPDVRDPRTRPIPPARRGAVDAPERPLAQA